MWDIIKNLLGNFGPVILIVGFIGFCFLSILVVSRLEKHFIHQFVPATLGELPPASPYFQTMDAAAPALGYQHCGYLLQSRNSSLYKCSLSLWVSPSQGSLLIVGGGKLAGIDYKRTMLISVVNDDKVLVTMDDFGVCDLSGIREIEVVLRASLAELHAKHLQRLSALPSPPRPFSAGQVLQQYEGLEMKRVEKMAFMGLVDFLDMSHTGWRYTFKGAWKSASESYLKGLKKSFGQADRWNNRRPGS